MAERHHICHAYLCETPVPPRMHMCGRHWRMVPKALQDDLWANYRRGQERDMQPSVAYLHAAAACVRAVAENERHPAEEIKAEVAGYYAWAEMLEDEQP